MATEVYGTIANYLKKIHDDCIWPALAPQPAQRQRAPAAKPDNLSAFRRLLMRIHFKAVVLFNPVEPAVRPCTSNDECRQDEECIKGVCTPISGGSTTSLDDGGVGRPCRSNDECRQDEECIDGLCTPVPFDLIFADVADVSADEAALPEALEAYWGRIHAVIVTGLTADRSKLAAVRDLLMQAYADASRLAGRSKPCKDNTGCLPDHVCVDGVCVPLPFRLVFRALGAPRPAPWVG